MAFAVGKPTDQRLAWEGAAPTLASTEGAAVAFAMVEGECEAGLAASYRGYELRDANVHILLEPAIEGRPHLSGAIVPKPQPGGAYVIVPPKDSPFGRSRTPGEAYCTLSEGRVKALPAKSASASPADTTTQAGTLALRRRQLQRSESAEVPRAEEFADTPSDIRDDDFDGQQSARDGFHLALMAGAEYPLLKAVVDPDVRPLPLSGLGFGFDLAIGGNVVPGLALGVMVGGATAPNPSLDAGGDISTLAEMGEQAGWDVDGTTLQLNGTSVNLFRVGVLLDYYFTPNTNWHGLVSLGYSSVSFTGGALDDEPSGFAASAGVGYDIWLSYHWSLGLMGRVQWSPLGSDRTDQLVHLISPHFGLTGAFH